MSGSGELEPDVARGEGNPIETAILFVDLVGSSVFASVLGLRDYAEYVSSFNRICLRQCEYFFKEFLRGHYHLGADYEIESVGDETAVFLHTDNTANDVYLLTVLGITLKCAWLGSSFNRRRLDRRTFTSEIGVGVNFGKVWSRKRESGYSKIGYAINLTKRIETHSRNGDRYRIFLSDAAFKQINTRMRNLVFGPRLMITAEGILGEVGLYELYESFVEPVRRMEPNLGSDFKERLSDAIENNSRDLWIHSSLQLSSEADFGHVTETAFHLCEQVLNMDASNPVALYYLAQGYAEHGDTETALSVWDDLTRFWPRFGDGWLEYGLLLEKSGHAEKARAAFIKAKLCGVAESPSVASASD